VWRGLCQASPASDLTFAEDGGGVAAGGAGAAAGDAQIDMAFSDPIAAVPQVRAGRIKAYGVTTKTRLAARLETLRSGANTHRRSAGGTCVISLAPRWKVT
jgi:hypothetical protein